MNASTLLGFLLSLVIFLGALGTSTKNVRIFLDFHAILIVIGGTAAVSLVCFSLPKIFNLLGVFFRRLIGSNRKDYQKLLEEILFVSAAYRRGPAAFESATKAIKDHFLRDAAEVLFWLESEVTPEKLRIVLETQAKTHYNRYLAEAEIFRTMSKFPPAFGLMGTTLGMIALLQSLGSPDARNSIGPSMSIALVATLYGIVLANFVFVPIAENLTQQTKDDLVSRTMVIEGIMHIAAGEPTTFVEEAVKAFLLPGEKKAGKLTKRGTEETSNRKAA